MLGMRLEVARYARFEVRDFAGLKTHLSQKNNIIPFPNKDTSKAEGRPQSKATSSLFKLYPFR